MFNISIIVAKDLQNAIGKDNNLLCYLPNDLRHFKSSTSGHTVIMGRKTFESLPKGALPNRRNIVLTRNSDFSAHGIELAHSLDEALAMLGDNESVFIIGGGSLYQKSIDLAQEMWVTEIQHKFEGADTFFPEIDLTIWEKVSEQRYEADDKNAYAHNIILYTKI